MKKRVFLIGCLLISMNLSANEMEHQHASEDHSMDHHSMDNESMHGDKMGHSMDHGSHQVPIGVMGSQVHEKGHFMLSI